MLNNQPNPKDYFAKSALEIGIRAREQERQFAIMNAIGKSEMKQESRASSDHFLVILTSLFSLSR